MKTKVPDVRFFIYSSDSPYDPTVKTLSTGPVIHAQVGSHRAARGSLNWIWTSKQCKNSSYLKAFKPNEHKLFEFTVISLNQNEIKAFT